MFRNKHEKAIPGLLAIAVDNLEKIRMALQRLADNPTPLTYTPRSTPANDELRPCYVAGRKAIFHRWVNTARPALPKGVEHGENPRFFQYRATTALVEYEDGTMDTVWPAAVKFADHGRFRDYAWEGEEASL